MTRVRAHRRRGTNGVKAHKRASSTSKKEKYTIIIDAGKPYDVVVYGHVALKKELRRIYLEIVKNNDFQVDVKVYNEHDEDISESQFITEVIGEIMDEEGD